MWTSSRGSRISAAFDAQVAFGRRLLDRGQALLSASADTPCAPRYCNCSQPLWVKSDPRCNLAIAPGPPQQAANHRSLRCRRRCKLSARRKYAVCRIEDRLRENCGIGSRMVVNSSAEPATGIHLTRCFYSSSIITCGFVNRRSGVQSPQPAPLSHRRAVALRGDGACAGSSCFLIAFGDGRIQTSSNRRTLGTPATGGFGSGAR